MDSYERARMLVNSRCRGRPNDWKKDVASVAFTRWLAESRGAPVDQWVTWEIAAASEQASKDETASKHAASDPDNLAGAPGVGARLSFDGATFPNLDAAKPAVLAECEEKFYELVGVPWDELPNWAEVALELPLNDADSEMEERASAALQRLQTAAKEVLAVGAGGAVRASFARRIADELAGGDSWQQLLGAELASSDLDISEASLRGLRQRIAYRWPAVRALLKYGITPEGEREILAGRFPIVDVDEPVTSRELAIVAILKDDWPTGMQIDERGVNVAKVIKTVERGYAAGPRSPIRAAEKPVQAARAYRAEPGDKKS